jgi:hypothetical protein
MGSHHYVVMLTVVLFSQLDRKLGSKPFVIELAYNDELCKIIEEAVA